MPKKETDAILYGAAYYDEYMPRDLDRIDTDMDMMVQAGINVIRIGESTWSTCEPQPGIFDWTHIDRSLDAAERHGISVIAGTPTYAVPTWLVKMYPQVLAETVNGQGHYGARQIMNIVNPAYRFYGEGVIRALISHVADRKCVIGYQVDNETKYYDSVSDDMQILFVKYLRKKFHDNLEDLNAEFGLDYWSNRINAWEDFPDVRASINQSLRGEFDKFRRATVAEYLQWQADIVRDYAREDQFITQNFDYEWVGWSYGLQPAVDHFKAARAIDIAGVDIYHPSEDELTGKEIAFGGDLSRSLKDGNNYIVLETQAQGQNGWLPYPGQLKLQAFSHLASGADGVMYWHWHSIHNSFETYWKGLLSQDFESNPVYEEAGECGRFLQTEAGKHLMHLKKNNQVAIMVSNEALSALSWFSLDTGFPGGKVRYNTVLRRVYDALFDLNIEADFLPTDAPVEKLEKYALIITPALYTADQKTIDCLKQYVQDGGHLVSTLRSFVANDYATVWHDRAPHTLTDVFGMTYNTFTCPQNVPLAFRGPLDSVQPTDSQALIELINPGSDTEVLASYDHYAWNKYAAITRHAYGSGDAEWIGTLVDAASMRKILAEAADNAGVSGLGRGLAGRISLRTGTNSLGERVTYLLNYSADPVTLSSPVSGSLLLGGADKTGQASPELSALPSCAQGDTITVDRWGVQIILSRSEAAK